MKLLRCLILAIAVMAACTNPVCGCPPLRSATAMVWGHVTDSGLPRSNAIMLVAMRDPGTPCVLPGAMIERGNNDAQGSFRIMLFKEVELDSVCVFVGARLGSGNDAQYAVRGPFWLRLRRDVPFDSANVTPAFP